MAITVIKLRSEIHMNSHMAGRATSSSAGKPSLYTDTSTPLHSADAQGDSILGGLEHSRPNRIRLVSVLGIAVASAIAIGWWQAGGLVRKKDAVPVVLAAAPQASTASAAAIPPKEPMVQSAMGEATGSSKNPAEQMSATIISESENADAMSSALPQDTSAIKPGASLQVADSVDKGSELAMNTEETTALIPMQAATVSKRAPALAQETKAKAKAVHSAGLQDTPKQKAAALADAQMTMKSQTTAKANDGTISAGKSSGNSGNVEAKTKHAGKDGDVELIAALLNRVSARSEPVSEDTARKPVSGRGASRLSPGDQKKAKKAGVTRESVSPTLASADIQLKQCGTMGFLESELCRFKVCDGRWGRDPACPEYSHASAALP